MNIQKQKKIIDKYLKQYLYMFEDAQNPLFEPMEYALFPGGKRIRPILAIEAAKACGVSPLKAMPAACAVEIIHSFSLVHDDLPSMDNDDYRRGKLSVHKRFGEGNAVLAGDALLVFAFALLSKIKDKKILSLILKQLTLSCGSFGMIGGQAYDVKYEKKKKGTALRKKINYLKTAELFILSMRSGAFCANATKKQLNRLTVYGKLFGEAFQIRDDVYDDEYTSFEKKKQIKKLKEYIEKAKQTLDIFGKKADNLRCLVDKLIV